MIYLLNTPVLTAYGNYRFTGPLDVEEARELVDEDVTSAIGHQGAADFLSRLLGIEIPVKRITIAMEAGDRALILRLKGRLTAGKLLSAKEMEDFPFELGLLERTK